MKNTHIYTFQWWKFWAAIVVAAFMAFQGIHSAEAVAMTSDNVTVFHAVSKQAVSMQNGQFQFRQLVSDSSNRPELIEIVKITMPVGDEGLLFKKHVVDVDEDIYIESGTLSCAVDRLERLVSVESGDIVHIPAGVPYGCESLGPDAAKLFLITSSSALEDFMTEVTSITGNPSDLLNSSGKRMDEVTKIAKRYGISFLN